MAYQPLVSIIIAVKNAKDQLKDTLESIRILDYPHLDIVVVDGASSDGTLKVIEENHDIISTYVSEPDQGISDAFNKGLQIAKGEYINFQGAGDTFVSCDCIHQLFAGVDESVTLLCGKVVRVEEDGVTPIWVAPKSSRFKPSSLLFKMSLPHQGLFTHRRYFETYGHFDLSVKFAMDYELLLRSYSQFPKTIVKDTFISRWRQGGVGSGRIFEIFDEYHRIKCMHHVANQLFLKGIDAFNRLKYIIKAKCLRLAY